MGTILRSPQFWAPKWPNTHAVVGWLTLEKMSKNLLRLPFQNIIPRIKTVNIWFDSIRKIVILMIYSTSNSYHLSKNSKNLKKNKKNVRVSNLPTIPEVAFWWDISSNEKKIPIPKNPGDFGNIIDFQKSPIPGDKNSQILKIPKPRDKNPQIWKNHRSRGIIISWFYIWGFDFWGFLEILNPRSHPRGFFDLAQNEKSPSPIPIPGILKKSHPKATSATILS